MFKQQWVKVIFVAAALGGCSAANGLDSTDELPGPEEHVGVSEQSIRNADGSGNALFTVGMRTTLSGTSGGTTFTIQAGCTGIALSPHWVLTAAHCVHKVEAGIEWRLQHATIMRQPSANFGAFQQIYSANVQSHVPAGWNPTTKPVNLDVALVQLTAAAMSPQPSAFARIYDDEITKLSNHVQSAKIDSTGWGFGNFDTSCTLQTLRPRHGRVSGSLFTDAIVGVRQDLGSQICGNDSGGPWWTTLGPNSRQVSFSLAASSALPIVTECNPNKCLPAGQEIRGVFLKAWIGWITNTTATTAFPLNCQRFSEGGWRYRRCSE